MHWTLSELCPRLEVEIPTAISWIQAGFVVPAVRGKARHPHQLDLCGVAELVTVHAWREWDMPLARLREPLAALRELHAVGADLAEYGLSLRGGKLEWIHVDAEFDTRQKWARQEPPRGVYGWFPIGERLRMLLESGIRVGDCGT